MNFDILLNQHLSTALVLPIHLHCFSLALKKNLKTICCHAPPPSLYLINSPSWWIFLFSKSLNNIFFSISQTLRNWRSNKSEIFKSFLNAGVSLTTAGGTDVVKILLVDIKMWQIMSFFDVDRSVMGLKITRTNQIKYLIARYCQYETILSCHLLLGGI